MALLLQADRIESMMKTKLNILVIEDEEAIRTGLIDVLIYHGYEVDFAVDGKTGLQKAQTKLFDLILLDVMMPGMSGFEVCEQIRKTDAEQSIIMLTAMTADEDIIQGLSLGADDYVSKPFSVAQLVLRIQAVLRRSRVVLERDSHIHLSDSLIIDCQNLEAKSKTGKLTFTRREMDILQYLHQHHQRPVSREELLNKVWGYSKELSIETRTVDIHIAKLRKKIEKTPAAPEYLTTIRGAGYRLLCMQTG